MSYIDAKWEEPNLRVATPSADTVHHGGFAAWLARQVTAFRTWHFDRQASHELFAMSDRELMDIGLSRTDVGRAFNPAFNQDLRQRGAGV